MSALPQIFSKCLQAFDGHKRSSLLLTGFSLSGLVEEHVDVMAHDDVVKHRNGTASLPTQRLGGDQNQHLPGLDRCVDQFLDWVELEGRTSAGSAFAGYPVQDRVASEGQPSMHRCEEESWIALFADDHVGDHHRPRRWLDPVRSSVRDSVVVYLSSWQKSTEHASLCTYIPMERCGPLGGTRGVIDRE